MCPQRSLREIDGNMAVEVVFAALEELMILDIQYNVQISRGSAFSAGVTFTGNAELRTIVHSGRDFELERFFVNDAAFAVTDGATVLDDLSCAMALAAGTRDTEESLLETNLAISVACGACRRT